MGDSVQYSMISICAKVDIYINRKSIFIFIYLIIIHLVQKGLRKFTMRPPCTALILLLKWGRA